MNDNLQTNKAQYGEDAYIVLEIKVEKYKSLDEVGDLTSEQVNEISTMQFVHSKLLEYCYQYTMAKQTQERLDEIAYTTYITVTSTIIVLAVTSVAGAAISAVKTGSLASVAKTINAYALYKGLSSVVGEALEELYIDPWIEAYFSHKTKEWGWDLMSQVFFTTFMESIRETLMGGVAKAAVYTFAKAHAANMVSSTNQDSMTVMQETSATLKAQRLSRVTEIASSVLSTLMLFAGAIMPGAFSSSFTTGLATAFVVGGTVVDDIGDAICSFLRKGPPQKGIAGGKGLLARLREYIINRRATDPRGKVFTLSELQKPAITQEMMNKLRELDPQSIVERRALEQGLPIYSVGDFPTLSRPIQRTLYDFIDIEYQYSDGTKLLTPTSRFLSSKGLAIPLPKYRFTIKHVGKTVSIIYPIKTFQVSIVSFLEPSLGLVFLEKVSEVHFLKAKLASNILERIWLNGKTKSGARAWGIIYMWVNLRNDKFMYGRTEQRPLSRPYYSVGALSFRFDQYIAKAIYERRTDDSIYGDMYKLYVEAGEGQGGINNIIKNFKVSIVEVTLLTGDYDYDCNYIEAAEESYIKKSKRHPERAKKCYNIKESGKGAHKMTEDMLVGLPPIYNIDTIEPQLIKLMKNGYSTKVAASKLRFLLKTHKIVPSLSSSQLNDLCKILFDGKTYKQKRDEVLLEHIESLIDQGYIIPSKIASRLAGFDATHVFNFLAKL